MNATIRKTLRVGADGNLVVPMGEAEAGAEVEVTVSPVHSSPAVAKMTQEEYRALVDRFTGSWVGDFPELEDLPPEPLDEL
jgi:hypothetical protein